MKEGILCIECDEDRPEFGVDSQSNACLFLFSGMQQHQRRMLAVKKNDCGGL